VEALGNCPVCPLLNPALGGGRTGLESATHDTIRDAILTVRSKADISQLNLPHTMEYLMPKQVGDKNSNSLLR